VCVLYTQHVTQHSIRLDMSYEQFSLGGLSSWEEDENFILKSGALLVISHN